MSLNPHVARLTVYPIKSLDGVAVSQATFLPSGSLEQDRRFAISDAAGNFVNGKRNTRVHRLRSHFDLTTGQVSLSAVDQASPARFDPIHQRQALEAWLGDYFEQPVRICQNQETGFPDDQVSPGPTVVSTASLAAVAGWFPDLSLEEVRRRFRSNIEIDGVPAFWEDCLFGVENQPVAFQIGPVRCWGINPCQRCVVVTRDSQTGQTSPQFQKTFRSQRQKWLPAWAELARFNHYFRLAVNTQVPRSEAGKTITLGDPVGLI